MNVRLRNIPQSELYQHFQMIGYMKLFILPCGIGNQEKMTKKKWDLKPNPGDDDQRFWNY